MGWEANTYEFTDILLAEAKFILDPIEVGVHTLEIRLQILCTAHYLSFL